MDPRICLRPAVGDDEAFLLSVYASTRADELALVPWDDATKEQFVRFQFNAQSVHYRNYHPDATEDVILVDGIRAGRLYVDRTATAILVVDIALLPQFRGGGVGGGLVRDLLAEAARGGIPVRIHVEMNNAARHLYDRLGFREIGSAGIYIEMQWTPPAPGTCQVL